MTTAIYDFAGHPLEIVADGNVLVRCRWAQSPIDELITDYTHPVELALIRSAMRQFDEYRKRKRRLFDIPFRATGSEFQSRVWAEINRIPYGTTISYAELARRIGSPAAFRATANACGANPLAVIVPCHRVIASDGKPGGYNGGLEIKLDLLDIESPGLSGFNSISAY